LYNLAADHDGRADGGGINALDWIDTAHPEADSHIRSAVD
jgi:hypothetical protein